MERDLLRQPAFGCSCSIDWAKASSPETDRRIQPGIRHLRSRGASNAARRNRLDFDLFLQGRKSLGGWDWGPPDRGWNSLILLVRETAAGPYRAAKFLYSEILQCGGRRNRVRESRDVHITGVDTAPPIQQERLIITYRTHPFCDVRGNDRIFLRGRPFDR